MRVYVASDHGGFKLKEELKKHLQERGDEVVDVGNTKLDPNDDYPDFILSLAEKVALRQAQGKPAFGIVLGRSGNGEQIAANKVSGVRAAFCISPEMARKAREDNNANVLALGADFIDEKTAKKVVDAFLETPFSEAARHKRRLDKISSYEAA